MVRALIKRLWTFNNFKLRQPLEFLHLTPNNHVQTPLSRQCAYFSVSNTITNQLSPSPGLPADTRSEDVIKFFEGYGRIVDCRVMTGASLASSPCFVTKPCFQVLVS